MLNVIWITTSIRIALLTIAKFQQIFSLDEKKNEFFEKLHL